MFKNILKRNMKITTYTVETMEYHLTEWIRWFFFVGLVKFYENFLRYIVTGILIIINIVCFVVLFIVFFVFSTAAEINAYVKRVDVAIKD